MVITQQGWRGWSPAACVAVLLFASLAVTPSLGIDDFDDEVTIQELSFDVVEPRLLAGAKAILRGSERRGPGVNLGDSMLERDLDSESVQPKNNTFQVIPADPRLPEIQTNALRKQVTRKLELPNGMGVNIIYNPDLEKSSMAVSMEVGSWQDPDEALGMAHFIEHMLFMGTEQHPKPGNFDDFLSSHGAQISNAMTGSQATTYAFATPHEAFSEGISRFSEFFSNPLFDSGGANKEMHAVNQEFEMHKDEDFYRLYHVEKELSNPRHPCHRFTIGNLKTLGNVTHQALIKWYKAHYSANLMHVSVYTAQPLEQVAQQVANNFSTVKNRNYKRQNVGTTPTMDPALAGHVLHVKPLTAVRHATLKWDLPAEFAHMEDSDPGRFAGTVLGDEGPDSLTAHLRQQNLALGLSAGLEMSGRDNALFSISLQLSEKGMQQLDEVIGLCFRAVHQLGATPLGEHFFEEAQVKDQNSWKFQWRTSDVFDAAMGAAQAMIQEPLESYPAQQSVVQSFNASAVSAIFKALTPASVHVSVMGDGYDFAASKAVKQEKYYNVTYAVEPVSPAAMTLWTAQFDGREAVGPEFRLPGPNDKLPKDLAVSQVSAEAQVFPALPQPVLVSNDSFGELYVKTDDVFGDPYISGSFEIITDSELMKGDVAAQAKASVMASLWVSCIEQSLRTETYSFSTAGLSYGIGVGKGTNLGMSFSGMNTDGAVWEQLLSLVLTRMTTDMSVHTTQQEFNVIFQAVKRSLANGLKSGPSAQASRHLWQVMSNTRLPLEEQIKALNTTTYPEVVDFGAKILLKLRVKGFFYGQIPGERAVKYWTLMKKTFTGTSSSLSLKASELPEHRQFVPKLRVLPAAQGPFYTAVSGAARSNATILVVDGGTLPCDDKVALEMLYKEVRQQFFNELRTKQQTGYVAQTGIMQVARRTLAEFVVVSSWAGSADLLGRYEAFIKNMLDGLKTGQTLPEKNFRTIQASLLADFSKPIANIAGMASILQEVVKDFDGDFDAFKKRQRIIQDMTIQKIEAAARKMFAPSNKRRLAVLYSPQGVDPGSLPQPYTKFNNSVGVFQKRPAYSCSVCHVNCTEAEDKAKAQQAPPVQFDAVEALEELEDEYEKDDQDDQDDLTWDLA